MVMNKKISLILIIIALALLSAVPAIAGRNTSYSAALITAGEAETIISARSLKKDLVFSLSFDGRELIYDKESGTYFYSLTEGTEGDFGPDMRVVSDYGSVKACFVDSLMTTEKISSNESATLLFYNNDYYFQAGLKCTTLPLMSIDTNGEIGDEYSDMSMVLIDNRKNAVKSYLKTDGQIRKRGGLTKKYPKFPLRLKLQYYSPGESRRSYSTSLLGMRENSSWILYPAYNDEDKVRNVFSQNLWHDTVGSDNVFGVETGPEYRYLEVFIGGSYAGLYALGYTIDEESMLIDSEDPGQGLYKKVLDTRYDLLEMRDRNGDAVRGFRLITDQKDPEEGISDKWRTLVDYFLYFDEYSDDSQKLLQRIDAGNAIDFMLFTDLVQGDDSIYKNYYLAIRKDSQGNTRTLYCPWDLDATWGNEFNETRLNKYAQYSHEADYNFFMEDTYFEQIMVNADTGAIDDFIARYRELRQDLWSDDYMISKLDSYERDIFASGAYLREMERWPEASLKDDPKEGLGRFKKYVLERLSEMDAYFDRLEMVKGEPVLTRRTAAFKHFDEADYVIDIEDKSLLQYEEYVSFLVNVCHIDLAMVAEDVRYIVYLRDKDRFYYLPDIGSVGDVYVTEDFTLSIDICDTADYFLFFGDGKYTVLLDGVPCFDSSTEVNEGLIVSAIYNGTAFKMNTSTGYDLEIDSSVYEFYDLEDSEG